MILCQMGGGGISPSIKLQLWKLELFWNLNMWGETHTAQARTHTALLSLPMFFSLFLSLFLHFFLFLSPGSSSFTLKKIKFIRLFLLSAFFFPYFFTTVRFFFDLNTAHTSGFSSSISQISHGCISKIRPRFSSLNLWVLFGLFSCDFRNK